MSSYEEFYTNATYPVTVYDVDYETKKINKITVLEYGLSQGASVPTLLCQGTRLKFRTSVDTYHTNIESAEVELAEFVRVGNVVDNIKNKINSDFFTAEERLLLLAAIDYSD